MSEMKNTLGEISLEVDNLILHLQEIEKDISKFQWIRVKDRLPKELLYVLVYCKGYPVTGAHLKCERKSPLRWYISDWDEYDKSCSLDGVSHWMPVPNPPEEE